MKDEFIKLTVMNNLQLSLQEMFTKKPTLLLEMMKELMKVYLFLKFLVNIQ